MRSFLKFVFFITISWWSVLKSQYGEKPIEQFLLSIRSRVKQKTHHGLFKESEFQISLTCKVIAFWVNCKTLALGSAHFSRETWSVSSQCCNSGYFFFFTSEKCVNTKKKNLHFDTVHIKKVCTLIQYTWKKESVLWYNTLISELTLFSPSTVTYLRRYWAPVRKALHSDVRELFDFFLTADNFCFFKTRCLLWGLTCKRKVIGLVFRSPRNTSHSGT